MWVPLININYSISMSIQYLHTSINVYLHFKQLPTNSLVAVHPNTGQVLGDVGARNVYTLHTSINVYLHFKQSIVVYIFQVFINLWISTYQLVDVGVRDLLTLMCIKINYLISMSLKQIFLVSVIHDDNKLICLQQQSLLRPTFRATLLLIFRAKFT